MNSAIAGAYLDKKKAQFCERVRGHLALYKTGAGIADHGIWRGNGRKYPHILPDKHLALNILAPFRDDFWKLFQGSVKLHQDFHHLNSSQALCFNLFAPFVLESRFDLLQEALGLDAPETNARPQDWGFERVFEVREGTNFDFFLQPTESMRLYFELKYTEEHFGPAKNDEKHRKKLETIYRHRLMGKVVPRFTEGQAFFDNYQILRNLSYLGPESHVFFVVPKANESLAAGIDVILGAPTDEFRPRVHLLFLEDLLGRIQRLGLSERMAGHFQLFATKYVDLSS